MNKYWVLYYKVKNKLDNTMIELNHYKVFVYKKDLAQFLMKQRDNFFTIAIQRVNLSKSSIIDKNYEKISLIMKDIKKGGE